MDNINKYVELLEQRRKEQNIDNELSKIKLQKKSIENRLEEIKRKAPDNKDFNIQCERAVVIKKTSIGTPFSKIDVKKIKKAINLACKDELRNEKLVRLKESEELKNYIKERFGKSFNSQKLLIILQAFQNRQDIKFDFDNFISLELFKEGLEGSKYFIETFVSKYNIDITLLNLIDTEENRVLLN